MKPILSTFALLVLIGAGCASTPSPPPQPAPQQPGPLEPYLVPAVAFGQEFRLEKDESRVFEDGLTVALVAIEDSRCPEDVVCVWAGELSYLLGLSFNDFNPPKDWVDQTRLATATAAQAEANGYRFTLIEGREDGLALTVVKR